MSSAYGFHSLHTPDPVEHNQKKAVAVETAEDVVDHEAELDDSRVASQKLGRIIGGGGSVVARIAKKKKKPQKKKPKKAVRKGRGRVVKRKPKAKGKPRKKVKKSKGRRK